MTYKHCDHHSSCYLKHCKLRCKWAYLLIFIFILLPLLVILLILAILRPTKPCFILQDATVCAFNVSAPNIITTNIQITLSSRNPNDNIGIYYDKLDVYAVYRNQQITLRTSIPPSYQGHKGVDVWSPFVYGNCVPVAPYNGVALSQEQFCTGSVVLMIKVDGLVRWKVGTFITGRYHLYVKCPAYIMFCNQNTGIVVGDAVKYQLVQKCSVSVWPS